MPSKLARRLGSSYGLSNALAALAAILTVIFFVTRAAHGIWFRSWGDELEHLLGGWALTSGDRLYVSFVDLHGPFIFFLAKSYGDLFGWAQGNYIRIIPIFFLLLSAMAVATGQSLCNFRQRCWAVTLFIGLSTTVWIVQGLYLFEYYLISGALLSIVLACYAVPAWLDHSISRRTALLSGVAATLAVFTSHAWLPTAGTLFLSTLLQPRKGGNRKASAVAFISASVITAAACLAWLSGYGSLRGYFVYHIIFAHTVYLQVVGPVNPELTLAKFAQSLLPSLAPDRLVQTLGDLLLLVSAIVGLRVYRPAALAVGVIAILAADARGNVGFQDGTFLILSIAFSALTMTLVLEHAAENWLGSILTTLICLSLVGGAEKTMRRALSSPNSLTRQMITHDQPVRITAVSEAAEFSFIRTIVRPNERVLSLIYRPYDYWLIGRLPMKGFYEYLPDDALYAGHPILGIKRDLCKALHSDPPPVVIFDDWKVWDYYAPEDYMPCVVKALHTEYARSSVYPTLFVRHDRVPPLQ